MKNRLIALILILAAVAVSCVDEHTHIHIYPEREVVLKTKSIITTVERPFARLAALDLPEYQHDIPEFFDVWFIATTGSDQGQVIEKFEGLGEGSHTVTVPARAYKVVISNFVGLDTQHDKRRNWLPENSAEIYLFGEANIDFSEVSEGEVVLTNDYAASMVYKNEVVKSVPAVNGSEYFDSSDYYIMYLRDQNGSNNFNRNTQVSVLTRNGGTVMYNLNHGYAANTSSRFVFGLYDEAEGNLTISIDEDVLRDSEDVKIVPNQ